MDKLKKILEEKGMVFEGVQGGDGMSYIVPQKMPLRCFECAYISSSTMDGYSCKVSHKSLASEHGINISRPDWCPLVEIPTPHGRLGDLGKLFKEINIADDYGADALDVLRLVKDAPTVIEAEGSEE